jgi:hypothetical protein
MSIDKKELDELGKERPAARLARRWWARTRFWLDLVVPPVGVIYIVVWKVRSLRPGSGWLVPTIFIVGGAVLLFRWIVLVALYWRGRRRGPVPTAAADG